MEHRLRPEAAADIGRDDAKLMLVEAERRHQNGFRPVRHLRAVPDGQHVFVPIEARQDPARLDGTTQALVQLKAHGDAMRGGGETGIHIAIGEHMLRHEIVRAIEPRARGAGRKPRNRIGDNWQGIGVDFRFIAAEGLRYDALARGSAATTSDGFAHVRQVRRLRRAQRDRH